MPIPDVREIVEPTRISRALFLFVAIAAPPCIQAGMVIGFRNRQTLGFPYDFYLAWSVLIVSPLLGFFFIWRQFRGLFLPLVVLFVLYFPTMVLLTLYFAIMLGHRFGGDFP